MKKLHVTLFIFLINIYQKNNLGDPVPPFSHFLIAGGVLAVPFLLGSVVYGLFDDQYWNNYAPTKEAIKHFEENLKKPCFKDPIWQQKFNKKLEELNQRLEKEEKQKSDKASKKRRENFQEKIRFLIRSQKNFH